MISFSEKDVIAVDLGGTKVVAAIVAPDGEIKRWSTGAHCARRAAVMAFYRSFVW